MAHSEYMALLLAAEGAMTMYHRHAHDVFSAKRLRVHVIQVLSLSPMADILTVSERLVDD